MAPIDLTGRPIAITGASSGIGLATALACARAGMPVIAAARRADRLEDLVARIRAAGGRALAVRADVSRPEDCARMIDACIAEFGSIYAVFANAGYGLEGPVHALAEADLRAIFETNFWGTLHTIRPALPHLRAARAGHILICTSCVSKLALPFFSAYTATKACQDHIGRAMRIELAGEGVRVSTIHPIGTRTEFRDVKNRVSGRPHPALHTPERIRQSPERVADAIVRCHRRPRGAGGEVWTSVGMRLAFALATALPGLADRVLARIARNRADATPASDPAPPAGG